MTTTESADLELHLLESLLDTDPLLGRPLRRIAMGAQAVQVGGSGYLLPRRDFEAYESLDAQGLVDVQLSTHIDAGAGITTQLASARLTPTGHARLVALRAVAESAR